MILVMVCLAAIFAVVVVSLVVVVVSVTHVRFGYKKEKLGFGDSFFPLIRNRFYINFKKTKSKPLHIPQKVGNAKAMWVHVVFWFPY